MMLALILFAAAQDAGPPPQDRVSDMMASYSEQTRADVPCRAPGDGEEIVICARRDADRYRIPLVAAGSAKDSVPLRTAELTRNYGRIPCGQSAFTAQCGPGFGVGLTVSSSGHTQLVDRKLAP